MAARKSTESHRKPRLSVSRASLLQQSDAGLLHAVQGDPALMAQAEQLAQRVRFILLPRTRGGERLQHLRGRVAGVPLDPLRPDDGAADRSAELLRREGVVVERVGRFGITASAPAELVEQLLETELALATLPRPSPLRATRLFSASMQMPTPQDLFVAPRQSLTVGVQHLGTCMDDVVFIPKPMPFAPAHLAPSVGYHHLPQSAVRQLLRVPVQADGAGTKVAMIDTGFDVQHPYYVEQGFDFQAIDVYDGQDTHIDTHGHGTAMAWNVFAVAPKAQVMGFKNDSVIDALEEAVAHGADIVSCSWGYNYEQTFPVLELTIRHVVEEARRVVLFASGNGQYAWPGSMPQVISVGGVFASAPDEVEASNYASGFVSSLYPQRRVPDVCGLCGQSPRAVYLPLPVPPGCEMDHDMAGNFPDGDGTATDDGWAYASGTSSATPQVAGVAALLLQAARQQGRTLDTTQVREALERSARPVERGQNAQGFPAIGHPNTATGFGLVQADAALKLVEA